MAKLLYVAASAVVTLALGGLVAWFAPSRPAVPAAPQVTMGRSPAAPVPIPAGKAPPAGAPSPSAPGVVPARPTSSVAPPPKAADVSFDVVHKHALRGCRGRLTVSSGGISFVPEKAENRAKDSFTLKYREFVSSVSRDEFTVKSSARTYRFKAADGSGGPALLQAIQDRITRLKPAPRAK